MEFDVKLELCDDQPSLLHPYKKLGLLGGTFNPVHNGHIELALHIKQEFSLEMVVFIPSANPPHKQGLDDIAPAPARLQMAALGTMEYNGLCTSSMEIQRGGLSYTIDTMRELTSKYKETEFHFIIGSDELFALEGWKDVAGLCRLTRFICVRRPEDDKLSVAAQAAKLSEKYNAVIAVSEYVGLFVSSSYIRKTVAAGKDISGFVPALVEDYIHASGLYK